MAVNNEYKNKVSNAFGRKTSSYDQYAEIQKSIAKKLCAMIDTNIRNPSILEIGCGTGFLSEQLIKKFPDADFDITDISQDMLRHCKKRLKSTFGESDNTRFFVMDGENLQFASEELQKRYDLIVSSMSFQWFCNPQESLRNLQKYSSRIYFAVLGNKSFYEWKDCLQKLDLSDGTINLPQWQSVIHEEIIEKNYENAEHFLKTVKLTGASTPKQQYRPLSVSDMRRAMGLYNKTYKGKMTWHIVYCLIDSE